MKSRRSRSRGSRSRSRSQRASSSNKASRIRGRSSSSAQQTTASPSARRSSIKSNTPLPANQVFAFDDGSNSVVSRPTVKATSLLVGSMDDIGGQKLPVRTNPTSVRRKASNSDLPSLPPAVPAPAGSANGLPPTLLQKTTTTVNTVGNHVAPSPTVNGVTAAPTVASFSSTESEVPGSIGLGADGLGAMTKLTADGKQFVGSVKQGKGRIPATVELTHTSLKTTNTTLNVVDSLSSAAVATPGVGLAVGGITTLKSGKKMSNALSQRNSALSVAQGKNTPENLKQIALFTADKADKKAARAGTLGVIGASGITTGVLGATGVGAVPAMGLGIATASIGGVMEGQKVVSKGSKIKKSGGSRKETFFLQQSKVAKKNEQKIIASDVTGMSRMSKPDQQIALAKKNPAGERKHMSNALVASIQEGGADTKKYQDFAQNSLGIKEKYLSPQTQEDTDKLTAMVEAALSST